MDRAESKVNKIGIVAFGLGVILLAAIIIIGVLDFGEKPWNLIEVEGYEDIEENNYNLSVSTYVEPEDTREQIDIVKLNAEIKEIVAREQVLRDEIDKIIAEIEV